MKKIDVKQHPRQPRHDWSKAQWLQHAYIEYWSPWNDEDTKQYWHDKIKELT
tara:strand:+ start:167 stop:322 length:156 start_codon:yes stop_codon:yes gene_type:complete